MAKKKQITKAKTEEHTVILRQQSEPNIDVYLAGKKVKGIKSVTFHTFKTNKN